MEQVNCALCQSSAAPPYVRENGYRAVRCEGCALVYCNPRPSIEEMRELYEGQETQIDLRGHLLQRDRKLAEAEKALSYIQRYVAGGRLLEVGSAAGYFLWAAQQRGFEVQGLDITEQFVNFSRDVLGVPAHRGTLREVPFAPASFDLVYHRNVLSHLAYPVEEFRILRELLRPGGTMVFETGNVAELPPSAAGRLELPDHLYHFSEQAIRKLLEVTGFDCVRVHRFFLIEKLRPIPQLEAYWRRRATSARKGRHGDIADIRDVPTTKPALRRLMRLGQTIRYDLGERLPTHGHRCTLLVVAQRPADA
jgi:2-polyprenyl-3-methyl-5-hydroxy-6-metoxy-1,4-benzoquinol methylase